MNKKFNYILISLMSIMIIFLIIIMIYGIKNDNNLLIFSPESKIVLEEKYDTNDVKEIKVNSISSDVYFKDSEDNTIKVVIYSGKDDGKVNLVNDILEINKDEKIKFCLFCLSREEIYVYLPKNMEQKVSIKTTSGDIEVKDLESLDLETVSGDVNINQVKNVNINTISGDVEIKNILNTCNIKTTSGDININDLYLKNNSFLESVSGNIEVIASNKFQVIASSTSGDIRVKEDNSDNVLKVKTISGDILVK